MTDKRTINQNRRLYWLLGELDLKDCVGELVMRFTGNRTEHTSEMSFIECMNLIRYLDQFVHKAQEHPQRQTNSTLDKHRKGVLKAITEYGKLCGLIWNADYVKGVACRAAGCDRFNDIKDGDLVRIYNEFCRKQSAARARQEAAKNALPTISLN